MMMAFFPILTFTLISSGFTSAEERLSWFSRDQELRRSTFIPDNLLEGREEDRVLPWVFHDDEAGKVMELKCIMRGYNVTYNPSNYRDARWSHSGFDNNQVDTSSLREEGTENGVPYAIWTIRINTTAADAGIKKATCEFQQEDFPLIIGFQFLIFRKVSLPGEENVVYDLGGFLDEKDLDIQVKDDIKRQISEHYSMPTSSVTRSEDGQMFNIKITSY